MEGVEDIPGTALHEGIDWEWETFPEYLDALDRVPARSTWPPRCRTPPCAPTYGRPGPRGGTAEDIATMATLTAEAMGQAPLASRPRGRSCTTVQARPGAGDLGAARRTAGDRDRGRDGRVPDGERPRRDAGRAGLVDDPRPRQRCDGDATHSRRPRGRRGPTGRRSRRPTARGRGRPAGHPPGVGAADRHAVRAAIVAAPLHHPPDVPGGRRPAARRTGRGVAAAVGAGRAPGRGTADPQRHRPRAR